MRDRPTNHPLQNITKIDEPADYHVFWIDSRDDNLTTGRMIPP